MMAIAAASEEDIIISSESLHIFPWEIYPDMAVLDWYIRLEDKQRFEEQAYPCQ